MSKNNNPELRVGELWAEREKELKDFQPVTESITPILIHDLRLYYHQGIRDILEQLEGLIQSGHYTQVLHAVHSRYVEASLFFDPTKTSMRKAAAIEEERQFQLAQVRRRAIAEAEDIPPPPRNRFN